MKPKTNKRHDEEDGDNSRRPYRPQDYCQKCGTWLGSNRIGQLCGDCLDEENEDYLEDEGV